MAQQEHDDEKNNAKNALSRGRSLNVDSGTGSPRSPHRDGSRRFYGVTVYDYDGVIVTIEPDMLAGRDIGAHEAAAIRAAIQQLSGFIGGR